MSKIYTEVEICYIVNIQIDKFSDEVLKTFETTVKNLVNTVEWCNKVVLKSNGSNGLLSYEMYS